MAFEWAIFWAGFRDGLAMGVGTLAVGVGCWCVARGRVRR